MSLGDAFPGNLAKASIERQLCPGVVIKIRATLDDGVEREKRFVVLAVDDTTVACVLNTKVNAIIAGNPSMLRCQVAVASGHEFADHDCHIDCSRVFTFSTDDVIKQLLAEKRWILGNVPHGLRDQIVSALKHSPTIPPVEVQRCCKALSEIAISGPLGG